MTRKMVGVSGFGLQPNRMDSLFFWYLLRKYRFEPTHTKSTNVSLKILVQPIFYDQKNGRGEWIRTTGP